MTRLRAYRWTSVMSGDREQIAEFVQRCQGHFAPCADTMWVWIPAEFESLLLCLAPDLEPRRDQDLI
jgi:hypothetical protein